MRPKGSLVLAKQLKPLGALLWVLRQDVLDGDQLVVVGAPGIVGPRLVQPQEHVATHLGKTAVEREDTLRLLYGELYLPTSEPPGPGGQQRLREGTGRDDPVLFCFAQRAGQRPAMFKCFASEVLTTAGWTSACAVQADVVGQRQDDVDEPPVEQRRWRPVEHSW
jgi:hypothetical protein